MAGIPEKMDWRDVMCMWAVALMLLGLCLHMLTGRFEFGFGGVGIAVIAWAIDEGTKTWSLTK